MANGVSNIMDEYQTLYDNYVKERTDQQNKIKAQMKQLAEQKEQLAAKDSIISSAVSAFAVTGKTPEEIAALLNIPLDVVQKITEI